MKPEFLLFLAFAALFHLSADSQDVATTTIAGQPVHYMDKPLEKWTPIDVNKWMASSFNMNQSETLSSWYPIDGEGMCELMRILQHNKETRGSPQSLNQFIHDAFFKYKMHLALKFSHNLRKLQMVTRCPR
ncbi:uncharacterized protein LOC142358140 isoform X2 [Convolutriloba macropyga]|uniref:uncharacterized protein LOC142358140 isoform X2 n=1 Tax=Convolutriloba macropyga TaxID=536237 RepID=UPI003F51F51A